MIKHGNSRQVEELGGRLRSAMSLIAIHSPQNLTASQLRRERGSECADQKPVVRDVPIGMAVAGNCTDSQVLSRSKRVKPAVRTTLN